jgi:predicted nuclease of predicted toxin-antitoxin system
MKLLFDQNLSPRLVGRLADLYAGSAHVSDEGLDRAADQEVWEYAGDNGFIIVSKDADFNEISVLRGYPPKIVWIRHGNCSTRDIEEILRRDYELVVELEQSRNLGILLLY